MIEPGTRRAHFFRPEDDDREGSYRESHCRPLQGMEVVAEHPDLFHELRGDFLHGQPEEVFDLGAEDQYGDARGETHRDGIRDELDRRAEPGQAHRQQHDAGHDRADRQIGDAVFGDDPINNHDECTGRSADLDPRTSERGDDEAGDDGGENAGLGFDS